MPASTTSTNAIPSRPSTVTGPACHSPEIRLRSRRNNRQDVARARLGSPRPKDRGPPPGREERRGSRQQAAEACALAKPAAPAGGLQCRRESQLLRRVAGFTHVASCPHVEAAAELHQGRVAGLNDDAVLAAFPRQPEAYFLQSQSDLEAQSWRTRSRSCSRCAVPGRQRHHELPSFCASCAEPIAKGEGQIPFHDAAFITCSAGRRARRTRSLSRAGISLTLETCGAGHRFADDIRRPASGAEACSRAEHVSNGSVPRRDR